MKKYMSIDIVNNKKCNIVDIDGICCKIYEALDSRSEKKLTRTVLELVKGCDGDKEAVAFAVSTAVDRRQVSVKEFNKVSKIMKFGMDYNSFMGGDNINIKIPGNTDTSWARMFKS